MRTNDPRARGAIYIVFIIGDGLIEPEAPQADFGFEAHSAALEHVCLDVADHLEHVGSGGATDIDDEPRMLGRDLGASDRIALHTGILDELPRKMALGPLERRPRRWEVERLLLITTTGQVVHAILDGDGIVGMQLQGYR